MAIKWVMGFGCAFCAIFIHIGTFLSAPCRMSASALQKLKHYSVCDDGAVGPIALRHVSFSM